MFVYEPGRAIGTRDMGNAQMITRREPAPIVLLEHQGRSRW
jgi:hypothetical protein